MNEEDKIHINSFKFYDRDELEELTKEYYLKNQQIIHYLKNCINLTYDYFSEDIDEDEYIFYLGKMRAYQQVLSIIEKSDK